MNKEVQREISAEMDTLFRELKSFQSEYQQPKRTIEQGIDPLGNPMSIERVAGDQAWQGLPTHHIAPKDGVALSPTRSNEKAGEHPSWNDAGIKLPVAMKWCAVVDVYEDSRGQGWTLTAIVEWKGNRWTRALNVGHLERDHDWRDEGVVAGQQIDEKPQLVGNGSGSI